MIASTLLAISSIAISEAMTASYQYDRYSMEQNRASASGRQLLEEVMAMPFSAELATASMQSIDAYTDEITMTGNATTLQAQVNSASSTSSTMLLGRNISSAIGSPVYGSMTETDDGYMTDAAPIGYGPIQAGTYGSYSSNGGTGTVPVDCFTRIVSVQVIPSPGGDNDATVSGNLLLLTIDVKTPSGVTRRVNRIVSAAEARAKKKAS